MDALTLTAPWGSAICAAAQHPELGKHIETRGWPLPAKYLGQPLAIYQAVGLPRGFSGDDYLETCSSEPFRSALMAIGITDGTRMPLGAIVAVVVPSACYQVGQDGLLRDAAGRIVWVSDRERAFGDYRTGRFAWLLAEIRALAVPVPARGAQRLWRVPGAAEAAVRAQLEASHG